MPRYFFGCQRCSLLIVRDVSIIEYPRETTCPRCSHVAHIVYPLPRRIARQPINWGARRGHGRRQDREGAPLKRAPDQFDPSRGPWLENVYISDCYIGISAQGGDIGGRNVTMRRTVKPIQARDARISIENLDIER